MVKNLYSSIFLRMITTLFVLHDEMSVLNVAGYFIQNSKLKFLLDIFKVFFYIMFSARVSAVRTLPLFFFLVIQPTITPNIQY